jgi:dTDP-4-dehydrorhamnose reductase
MATLHIVGAQGNIGSRLVEKTEGKYDIRKITSPSRVHLLTEANAYHVINLAEDISNYDYDTLKMGDTVAFTAAISEPSVCADQFEVALRVNITSTGDFIYEALKRGCKVIFLSSDAVYGNVLGEFNEEEEVDPLGVYAEMKAVIEHRFLEYPLFKVLRLSYNFFKKDRFTSYIKNCAEEGATAEIFDPFARSVVHRDDTVDAIISLFNNWDVCKENVINCGGPETLSRVQFADILKKSVFTKLKTEVTTPGDKFYNDRPAIVSMRSNLLEKVLGRPARSIEDAATLEFIDGN